MCGTFHHEKKCSVGKILKTSKVVTCLGDFDNII